jgi:D-xylose transport system ATP-binding protein
MESSTNSPSASAASPTAEKGAVGPPPLLEVRNLKKHFGTVQALRGVSLSLRAGQVTALVGDNGAGKSTLVKILTGVQKASSGEIYSNGEPVELTHPTDAAELGIAAVFQDLALCGNLDVPENIFLGREYTSDKTRWLRPLALTDEIGARLEAAELLKSLHVKLPDLGNRVEGLSGGQRQSVAIARALLGSPKIVILDEPTAALSVAQTEEVLALVKRLRARGMAVLIISHNLVDVFSVADVIAVLRLGANAAFFETEDEKVSQEAVIAAITGAEWGNSK